jgi:hypothetical protein
MSVYSNFVLLDESERGLTSLIIGDSSPVRHVSVLLVVFGYNCSGLAYLMGVTGIASYAVELGNMSLLNRPWPILSGV